MPAYAVAMMTVHDPAKMAEYARQAPPLVSKHGGCYLTRGEAPTCFEETSCGYRVVVSEWPSKAHAEAFFSDPDYLKIARLRWEASTMHMLFVQEGVVDAKNPEPHV